MASLKDIKHRINSINGTLKITNAMKMVASAKLHKAQGAIANMLPYEESLHEILSHLLADESLSGKIKLMRERPVKKVAVVAAASNSALCGAFNSEAIRLFNHVVNEYLAAGLKKEDILVYPVGRKMAEAAVKSGFQPQGEYNKLAEKHIYSEVFAFAQNLTDKFYAREIDKVELVYNHYKSSASQIPLRETYLPFKVSCEDARKIAEKRSFIDDYIIEPDAVTVINELLPQVLVLKINTMLLDANLAEHAARTVAMQEASDNGRKLLQELTLQYNKQRQQSITNELLDIVSGTMVQ